MKYLTINQTARSEGIPHTCLRRWLTEGKLPGFYSGTRYYVNVERLREKMNFDNTIPIGGRDNGKE